MSVRIRYSCPHCNRRILHHPQLAGQLVLCSACKGEFYEPTDPLPGKPAEQALQPAPQAVRTLRVPEGSDPKHDLAVLSRRDANDNRSILEIVEAVLLDDRKSPPAAAAKSESPSDSYELAGQGPARPGPMPPAQPAAPSLAGKPPSPAAIVKKQPLGGPQTPRIPSLAGPAMRPLVPTLGPTMEAATRPQASPKPAAPGGTSSKPIPAAGLAGVSIKQMLEELRRRGLGASLVTCEVGPLRNLELAFSENMTRDDAIDLLRRMLETVEQPKPAESPGLLKRLWKKDE